jgi:hypothetical protein
MIAFQRVSARVFSSIAFVLLGGSLLAGCGMPKSMEVTTGGEPIFEDKYVRFRTTYYFRVFDVCEELFGDGLSVAEDWSQIFSDRRGKKLRLLKDSIYRFRMTGQADSLTNDIRFEAGTLKAHQIDPFGAGVAFDKANNRFYFKSQQAVEEDGRREEAFARLQRYVKFTKELKDAGVPLNDELVHVMRDEMRLLGPVGQPTSQRERVTATYDNVEAARNAAFNASDSALRAVRAARDAIVVAGADAKPDLFDEKAIAGAADTLKQPLTALRDVARAQTSDARKYMADATKQAIDDEALAGTAVDQARDAVKEAERTVAALPKTSEASVRPSKQNEVVREEPKPIAATTQGQAGSAPQTQTQAKADDASQKLKGALDQLKQATDHQNAIRISLRHLLAAQLDAVDPGTPAAATSADRDDCPADSVRRRGFQVLGPEGVRTFNQDDRLLMAMSSDGAPLIGVLQEISARVLAQKSNEVDQLTPLAEERARVTKASRALSAAQPEAGATPTAVLAELLKTLDAGKPATIEQKEKAE